MPARDLLQFLDNHPPIDVSNPEATQSAFAAIIDRVSADRTGLAELVARTRQDPQLSSMCESDEFRTKFVLYDALDRGFRLRLHLWQDQFADTPHQHRFSYMTKLLNGSYEHTIFEPGQSIQLSDFEAWYDKLLPLDHPALGGRIRPEKFSKLASFTVSQGFKYFQSSDVHLSSTKISERTVSLFVRGPAVRAAAFQWHSETSEVVWRAGVADAPTEHLESVRLSDVDFDSAFQRVSSLGVFEEIEN